MTHTSTHPAATTWLTLATTAGASSLRGALSRRDVRILALLGVSSALGMLDLGWTLREMTSGGMFEANPLVRAIAAGGVGYLVAYKLCLMTIHASALWRCRVSSLAEPAAWISAVVLIALTVRWMTYFSVIAQIDASAWQTMTQGSPDWIVLPAH